MIHATRLPQVCKTLNSSARGVGGTPLDLLADNRTLMLIKLMALMGYRPNEAVHMRLSRCKVEVCL
jgi:hypothetical protein